MSKKIIQGRKAPEGGAEIPYQTLSTDVIVDKDMPAITYWILNAMNSLSVSRRDGQALRSAVFLVKMVQNRKVNSTRNCVENIRDILKAIEELMTITSTDITEIRLKLDGLLRYWEGRWISY